jgi:hypothetical protein
MVEQELRLQAANLRKLADLSEAYVRLVELADELNEMLASPGEQATVDAAEASYTGLPTHTGQVPTTTPEFGQIALDVPQKV